MQLRRQPRYDRNARRRIDDELIALRRRIPSLTVKVLADAVSELANLKNGIPEEYFYRLHTIKDEKWIDYIVNWIERLHNPYIRQELGADHQLHKLASAHIEWQTGIVSLNDWEKFRNLNRGWAAIEYIGGSAGALLLAPEERPYFLVLFIAPPRPDVAERHLWTGIAIPVAERGVRFMLRNDAMASIAEFEVQRLVEIKLPNLSMSASLDAAVATLLLGPPPAQLKGRDNICKFRRMGKNEIEIATKTCLNFIMENRLAKLIYLREANR